MLLARLIVVAGFAAIWVGIGSLGGRGWALLLGTIGGFLAWFWTNPARRTQSAPVSPAIPVTPEERKKLRSYRGMYLDLDIVGESHHQHAIRSLYRDGSDAMTFDALLTPETDNPYDENAVRVDIDGLRVGYLSRETAIDYRENMQDRPCIVPVHLVQGGSEGMIGVFTGRSKADRDAMRARRDGSFSGR